MMHGYHKYVRQGHQFILMREVYNGIKIQHEYADKNTAGTTQ